jgi:hypothetical protein
MVLFIVIYVVSTFVKHLFHVHRVSCRKNGRNEGASIVEKATGE